MNQVVKRFARSIDVPAGLEERLERVFDTVERRLGCSREDAERLATADIIRHGIERLERTR